MKAWQCVVCKYVHKGDAPPDKCPVCGAGSDKFNEIELPDAPDKSAVPAGKQEMPKTASPPKTDQGQAAAAAASSDSSAGPQTIFGKAKDLMIKHHAHPVLVHTPNGILPAAAVLFILSWMFDAQLLATAGFINLIFVILAMPLVIYTGVVAWEKKYAKADTPVFKYKILAGAMTAASCLISLVWYMIEPQVLSGPRALVFLLVNLAMLASAATAGHIGGKLVFKD